MAAQRFPLRQTCLINTVSGQNESMMHAVTDKTAGFPGFVRVRIRGGGGGRGGAPGRGGGASWRGKMSFEEKEQMKANSDQNSV